MPSEYSVRSGASDSHEYSAREEVLKQITNEFDSSSGPSLHMASSSKALIPIDFGLRHSEPVQAALPHSFADVSGDSTLRGHEYILGELFDLHAEGGHIIIQHPEWSLVGVGRNKFEAKQDLYSEIKEISDVILERSPLQMTEGGLKMRSFVYKVIKHADFYKERNPLFFRSERV